MHKKTIEKQKLWGCNRLGFRDCSIHRSTHKKHPPRGGGTRRVR